jgi:hypothetical protein
MYVPVLAGSYFSREYSRPGFNFLKNLKEPLILVQELIIFTYLCIVQN